MQYPLRVHVAKRLEQLAGDRAGRRGSACSQPLVKVAAGDVFHHQVRPLAGLAEVIDRDQVRVLEAGGDPCLALEPGQIGGLASQRVGEDLDRDRAVEPFVGGQPDHRHAAVAEAAIEHVAAPESPAGCDREGPRGLAVWPWIHDLFSLPESRLA